MSSPDPMPATPQGARSARFSLGNVIVLAVPLLIILGAVFAYYYEAGKRVEPLSLPDRLKRDVLSVMKLDQEFQDADGDLVADRPDKLLDPEKIVFRPLEEQATAWEGFRVHLQKKLGRQVEISTEELPRTEQLRRFKAGDIHLASFSTGIVPTAVNSAGFVPAFSMANDQGEYTYHAIIVVPEKSSVRTVQELKGHTLTLTALSSLSSFKAPLQVLGEAGLELDKDYSINVAPSQRASIEGLASGKYEAIAVASDLFQRSRKQKSEAGLRIIYTSPEAFPSACFGYHHALKKELADEIRAAFLEYPWDDRLKQEFGTAGYTRFVPISYKKDWEPVRKIDENIDRLLQRH